MAEQEIEETTTSENDQPQDKTIGIVAYLTVIGLIIAFIMNQDKKDPFGSFHIRQMLGITLTGFALGVVAWIPFLGWIVGLLGWIFVLVLWIVGFVNALGGHMKPVPLLGEKYAEWFANI